MEIKMNFWMRDVLEQSNCYHTLSLRIQLHVIHTGENLYVSNDLKLFNSICAFQIYVSYLHIFFIYNL